MVPLGTQAPGFTLPDTSGMMTGLDDFTAAPALLVAFLCNHCPYVRHVETALGTLLSRYPDLAVVGICTNDADAYPGDRPHELAGQARRAGWTFPYLVDADQTGRPRLPCRLHAGLLPLRQRAPAGLPRRVRPVHTR